MALLRGKVVRGVQTIENVSLSPKEDIDVSTSVLGFGHIIITVQVVDDDDILAEKQEDGFLFGGRVLLYYEEE